MFFAGKGVNTVVYEGFYEDFDKNVAIKQIPLETLAEDSEEISLLRQLDHPNVVRYYCSFQRDNSKYIVLDKCDCTLVSFVEGGKQDAFNRTDAMSKNAIAQITEGLRYLHNREIIHKDLKPTNILIKRLDGADNLCFRISDFGMSRKISEDLNGPHGSADDSSTLGWRAPELFTSPANASIKSDIFSMGCLVQYVFNQNASFRHPFGMNKKWRNRNISSPRARCWRISYMRPRKQQQPPCDIVLGDLLIDDMICRDPAERISCDEVLSHPFFLNDREKLDFIEEAYNNHLREDKAWQGTLDKLSTEFSSATSVKFCPWNQPETSDMFKIYQLMAKRARYNTDSLVNLVRMIRNIVQHFSTIRDSQVGRDLLDSIGGNNLDTLGAYFNREFPFLVALVYICVSEDGKLGSKKERHLIQPFLRY